jgi:hypothetical protein
VSSNYDANALLNEYYDLTVKYQSLAAMMKLDPIHLLEHMNTSPINADFEKQYLSLLLINHQIYEEPATEVEINFVHQQCSNSKSSPQYDSDDVRENIINADAIEEYENQYSQENTFTPLNPISMISDGEQPPLECHLDPNAEPYYPSRKLDLLKLEANILATVENQKREYEKIIATNKDQFNFIQNLQMNNAILKQRVDQLEQMMNDGTVAKL